MTSYVVLMVGELNVGDHRPDTSLVLGPLVNRSLGGGPETWPSLGFSISSLPVS